MLLHVVANDLSRLIAYMLRPYRRHQARKTLRRHALASAFNRTELRRWTIERDGTLRPSILEEEADS